MTNVILDYEVYYDENISVVTQGNNNYWRSSDAYIGALTVGDEVWCGTLKEIGPICDQLAKDPTVQFWAANSNFDQMGFEKYHGPSVHPWKCVLDLGAFHQLPRALAFMAKVELGHDVDKNVRNEMKGVRYEDLDEAGKLRVQNYCVDDVKVTRELLNHLPPMSAMEEKIAAHTRLINRRGVHIDVALVESDKTKLEAYRFEMMRKIPWRAGDALLSHPALNRWCASKGITLPKSLAKTDVSTTTLMTENPELNEVITAMREYRHANTVIKKIESLMARVCDGVLPLDLMYCGAPHTRRWSSRGFNVQNLEKEPMSVGAAGTIWSRNWLIPPPGKKFLILDLAQIQPRALNWAAGNEAMMEALRSGFSYYEAYARDAKPKVTEGWGGVKGTIKEFLGKEKYTKLKNESLGLGFGMGATKYTSYAKCTLDEAKPVVAGFRARNPLICGRNGLWKRFDNMIAAAARDREHHFVLEMPTGDLLQYFNVTARSGGGFQGYTIKGDDSHQSLQLSLWGGTMAENIAQRIERDIMGEAQLRLEAAGFPVAFNSHDETILVVDEDAGEAEQKEAEYLMTLSPEWAKDLPLGTEGSYEPCYTKK